MRQFTPMLDWVPPRLTTRRLDAFTPDEFMLLQMAEGDPAGAVQIVVGREGWSKFLDAAHALQRLGYFWPVNSSSRHFSLTAEGRRALSIARRRAAA